MLSRGCCTLFPRWKTCIFLRSTPGLLHSPNPSQHYPLTSLKRLLSASMRHISKCIHTGIIFLGKPVWPWLKRVLHELLTGSHMSTIQTFEWGQPWIKILALGLVLKDELLFCLKIAPQANVNNFSRNKFLSVKSRVLRPWHRPSW